MPLVPSQPTLRVIRSKLLDVSILLPILAALVAYGVDYYRSQLAMYAMLLDVDTVADDVVYAENAQTRSLVLGCVAAGLVAIYLLAITFVGVRRSAMLWVHTYAERAVAMLAFQGIAFFTLSQETVRRTASYKDRMQPLSEFGSNPTYALKFKIASELLATQVTAYSLFMTLFVVHLAYLLWSYASVVEAKEP